MSGSGGGALARGAAERTERGARGAAGPCARSPGAAASASSRVLMNGEAVRGMVGNMEQLALYRQFSSHYPRSNSLVYFATRRCARSHAEAFRHVTTCA